MLVELPTSLVASYRSVCFLPFSSKQKHKFNLTHWDFQSPSSCSLLRWKNIYVYHIWFETCFMPNSLDFIHFSFKVKIMQIFRVKCINYPGMWCPFFFIQLKFSSSWKNYKRFLLSATKQEKKGISIKLNYKYGLENVHMQKVERKYFAKCVQI